MSRKMTNKEVAIDWLKDVIMDCLNNPDKTKVKKAVIDVDTLKAILKVLMDEGYANEPSQFIYVERTSLLQ